MNRQVPKDAERGTAPQLTQTRRTAANAPAGFLADDVVAVLDVVLKQILDDANLSRGCGDHAQPVVVVRHVGGCRERQRRSEEFRAQHHHAAGDLVVDQQGA
jgi:hypothetical protein